MYVLLGIVALGVVIASCMVALFAVAIIELCGLVFGRANGARLGWVLVTGSFLGTSLWLHRSTMAAFQAGEDGPSGFMLTILYPYGWYAFTALCLAITFGARLESPRLPRSASSIA